MQPLENIKSNKIEFLFTDIDGTLTTKGQIPSNSYEALWKLHKSGIKVIPVTGRPAGWCEMIARTWPVLAVIGENGAFWFQYKDQKMNRYFEVSESERMKNSERLKKIEEKVLTEVKGSALASDQFTRIADLAIDFCEDVDRLEPASVQKIKKIFESQGAQAKISSIHVNGWFGNYDKATTCLKFAQKVLGLTVPKFLECSSFVGDSPNDEPLFKLFPLSFGVSNLSEFQNQMHNLPAYISASAEGDGFTEIANKILATSSL